MFKTFLLATATATLVSPAFASPGADMRAEKIGLPTGQYTVSEVAYIGAVTGSERAQRIRWVHKNKERFRQKILDLYGPEAVSLQEIVLPSN